jgi:hypothetical protein
MSESSTVSAAWKAGFIVRNFLVLYPEIGFQYLGCRHEPEYIYIAFRLLRPKMGRQRGQSF